MSEEEQLSRSFSITLLQEITSDDTVSLTVNNSNDSHSQKVTVESIIAFITDNGAPIGLDFTDAPVTEKEAWNGSLNTPLLGEKGMLTDGG